MRYPPPPPPPIREAMSMELTKDARGVPYYEWTDNGWKLRDDWMEHREISYMVKYGERPDVLMHLYAPVKRSYWWVTYAVVWLVLSALLVLLASLKLL